MQSNEVILHGEAMIFPVSEIPANAEACEMKFAQGSAIIADSETTGNHHVLDMPPTANVKFFRSGERLFFRCEGNTQVRCVHPDRHNAIAIPPGTYEVDRQKEYDHFAQNLMNVRD